MYEIRWSNRFQKDMRKCEKRNKNMSLFKAINDLLAEDDEIPLRHRDHILTGNWSGHRECHIQPDWLLIYKINEDEKIIEYIRTGSHSELFG